MSNIKEIDLIEPGSEPLKPEREAYCQYFVKYNKSAAAYRKAYGSTECTKETLSFKATRLKRQPEVKERIEYLQKQKRNKVSIDPGFLEDRLKHYFEIVGQEVYVYKMDEEGEQVLIKTFLDANAFLKAIKVASEIFNISGAESTKGIDDFFKNIGKKSG